MMYIQQIIMASCGRKFIQIIPNNYSQKMLDKIAVFRYYFKGVEVIVYFCSLLLNNMRRFLLMQKSRVLLEESTSHGEELALKLCVNQQILKFPNKFRWSEECQRWQSFSLIRFQYLLQCPVELQLYFVRDTIPLVIGEGVIYPSILGNHLNEEIKLLRYDGLVTGWLYCEFCVEDEHQNSRTQENQKFLSLQKINLHFLEEIEEQIKIKIKQNTISIYQKSFHLNQRNKIIFPNIKRPVRLSDVIKIQFTHSSRAIKPIMFLVDSIKRGTNATLQYWLRNNFKNKMGTLSLQYYMENIYLTNERCIRSRKAIIPDSIQYAKTTVANKINQKNKAKENEPQQHQYKKKIEDADRLILKINSQVNQMVDNIKIEEKLSHSIKYSQKMLSSIKNGLQRLSIRKRKPNFKDLNESRDSTKQKLSFYFQNQKN